MKTCYQITGEGFMLLVDRRVYARAAVMKALYRYTDDYTITYTVDQEEFVSIEFTARRSGLDIEGNAQTSLNDLYFEVIRFDTMRRTSGIRELLIGRALYATCIETDRGDTSTDDSTDSWEEDERQIFASWHAKGS